MGQVLAALLERDLDDAARGALDLDPSAVELPAEVEVRRLLEAAGLSDADAVLSAARADGDVFEGDDLGELVEMQAVGGRLIEAVGAGERPGTTRYQVSVIRPGRAQGYSRRYYSRKMLEANAGNFGGQPMFWNHEDLDVILKRGHGSRDPRDLCGWLQESTWWDPAYTEPDDAKNGRLKGAVMGHADVNSQADELLKTFPNALAVSVNMDSTKVSVGRADDGKLAPLVEGVVKGSGSLDLITGKAGAGGKVLDRLREASTLRYRPGNEDLADVPSDRLLEAVRARPELAEHFREAGNPNPEGSVSAIDPGKLVEALADEAVQTKILESLAGSPALDRIVEAKVAEREDEIRADAGADAQRALDLRDLRDDAHRLIEAHGVGAPGGILTPAYIDDLKSRYALRDGGHPTPALDVFPLVDEGGAVTKTARERLLEAVESDITRERAKIIEANPTRVHALGGAAPAGEGERIVEAREGESEEQRREREARELEARKPKDGLAEDLGLDSSRVRQYQGR